MLADRDALPLVVIAHEDPGTADALRHAVDTGAGWRTSVVPAGGGMGAALAAGATVALVGCGRLEELPATAVPVLAVGDSDHPGDLRAALAVGARGMVTWPDCAADLAGELTRLALQPRAHPRPAPSSTLVAVAGVQGGVGTTTICAHLAAAWARWGPRPVLLADLAGGLGFRLDLGTGAPSWATLAPIAGGLDGPTLAELTVDYWPNLSVLPLPGLPDGEAEPPPAPELVATVLSAAATSFRAVVVDLPVRPGPAGEAVLAAADVILAVARPDSAGVHALSSAYTAWSGTGDPPTAKGRRRTPRVGLVASGSSTRAPVARRQLEARLGDRLWVTIPAEGDELNAAAEDGILLLHRPEHGAVNAILTLAHRVLPLTTEAVAR